MNDFIVIDVNYLKSEFKMNDSFINRWSMHMGPITRNPRTYLLGNVIAFMKRRADVAIAKANIKKVRQNEIKELVPRVVEFVIEKRRKSIR